jgi:hypothetical protein
VSVNTSLKNVEHIKGRKYKVECDKRHRPAQIHRDVNVTVYEDEVTDDNAGSFELRYVNTELSRDVAKQFTSNFNMTYNDMVGVLLEVAAKHGGEIKDMLVVLGHAPNPEQQLQESIIAQRPYDDGFDVMPVPSKVV